MTYKKITEPINIYTLDEFIPLTMHADGLEFENDAYSIMEMNCELGHAHFINLNPMTVEMMDMKEIRFLILDALDAYIQFMDENGVHLDSKESALDHYLAQATPVADRGREIADHQS